MKTLLQWQIASSKVQSRSSDVDDEVPTMCRFLPPLKSPNRSRLAKAC